MQGTPETRWRGALWGAAIWAETKMTAVRRELCGFGGLGLPGRGNSRGQGLKQEIVRRQWLEQACEGTAGP